MLIMGRKFRELNGDLVLPFYYRSIDSVDLSQVCTAKTVGSLLCDPGFAVKVTVGWESPTSNI
jgi:hypothetical protein